MKKRVLEVMKAPTGWGKTHKLRNLARHKPVVLAVPTHAVAGEQYEKAKGEGMSVRYVKGRRMFVCGRKLTDLPEEERGKVAKWILPSGELKSDCPEDIRIKVGQDYLCCRRKGCQRDPFKEQFERGYPDLIILTHTFLMLAPFLRGVGYIPSGRTLAIDEADMLLYELERPRSFINSLSLGETVFLLREILKDVPVDSSEGEKLIEKTAQAWEKFKDSGVVALRVGDKLKSGNGFTRDSVSALRSLDRCLEKLHSLLPRTPVYAGYREVVLHVRDIVRRVLTPQEDGEYGWVARGRIGVSRLLFSRSMWTAFQAMISALDPVKVILATATLRKNLLSLFPSNRWVIKWTGAKPCDVPFPSSDLFVVIGNEEYNYEKIESYREYAVGVIKRFTTTDEDFVILTTSYEDMEFLAQELKGSGYRVTVQREEAPSHEAVGEWRIKGGVLIGNVGIWRGLNIMGADKFFIFKLPYEHPESPRSEALTTYSSIPNTFPIAREEARTLFAQGVGRVMREDGKQKFLFVLDRRVLKNGFLDVFKEVPCAVFFVDLAEEVND